MEKYLHLYISLYRVLFVVSLQEEERVRMKVRGRDRDAYLSYEDTIHISSEMYYDVLSLHLLCL